MDEYKSCNNPLCDFIVPQSVLYCCAGCNQAHEGKYEIHEDGPLGHGSSCARRTSPNDEPEWNL